MTAPERKARRAVLSPSGGFLAAAWRGVDEVCAREGIDPRDGELMAGLAGDPDSGFGDDVLGVLIESLDGDGSRAVAMLAGMLQGSDTDDWRIIGARMASLHPDPSDPVAVAKAAARASVGELLGMFRPRRR